MIVDASDADLSEPWRALRRTRSNRPRAVVRGRRATVFGTGLAQADELWRAADSVSPLAGPILRYYALAQAVQSVCAASRLRNDEWQAPAAHGLKLDCPDTGGRILDLREVIVREEGYGLIQTLGRALRSPVLCEPASLAEIIANTWGHEWHSEFTDFPHPVQVNASWLSVYQGMHTLYVGPVPSKYVRREEVELAGSGGRYGLTFVSPSSDELAEWFEAYPTLSSLPVTDAVTLHPDEGRMGDEIYALLRYPVGTILPRERWGELLDVRRARSDQAEQSGWMIPTTGSSSQPQHPLVGWHILLYSLSMLARYHPAEWRTILDMDKSGSADELAHLIDSSSEIAIVLVERSIRAFM